MFPFVCDFKLTFKQSRKFIIYVSMYMYLYVSVRGGFFFQIERENTEDVQGRGGRNPEDHREGEEPRLRTGHLPSEEVLRNGGCHKKQRPASAGEKQAQHLR